MKFAYHMYGENTGEFKLEKVAADGTRTQMFSDPHSTEEWKEYEISLPTENFDFEVDFDYPHTLYYHKCISFEGAHAYIY